MHGRSEQLKLQKHNRKRQARAKVRKQDHLRLKKLLKSYRQNKNGHQTLHNTDVQQVQAADENLGAEVNPILRAAIE